MNKDNAKDYLPLVQALADGKTIQVKLGNDSCWIDAKTPTFHEQPPEFYRIKPDPPKPREWWVNIYKANAAVHPDKKTADGFMCGGRLECVRVREIIEE